MSPSGQSVQETNRQSLGVIVIYLPLLQVDVLSIYNTALPGMPKATHGSVADRARRELEPIVLSVSVANFLKSRDNALHPLSALSFAESTCDCFNNSAAAPSRTDQAHSLSLAKPIAVIWLKRTQLFVQLAYCKHLRCIDRPESWLLYSQHWRTSTL